MSQQSAESEKKREMSVKQNENKIILTLLNGKGYIFDVEDYMQLRSHHRIIGNLVGITNAANTFRLPAQLSEFETRALVDEGIALLVSKKHSLLREPTQSELTEYEDLTEANIEGQADALKAERLREAERNVERILAGKLKKLERTGESTDSLTAESVLQEIGDRFVFDRNCALIEIACAHAERHEARAVQLSPLNSFELLKYRVFHDFWSKGKFVTADDAFGADFLIYPGDPMLYHASHIVIVLEAPNTVQLLSLITKVRLSVVIKKTCVLAYSSGNPTDQTIHYQTIAWDGNNDSTTNFKQCQDSCGPSTSQAAKQK